MVRSDETTVKIRVWEALEQIEKTGRIGEARGNYTLTEPEE
jgi:hypothetical protein